MSELRTDVPAKAASAAPALVVGVFEDEVRAEQAVRALEVWRGANRRFGVGPIGVVARHLSGSGAAWLAAWVLASVAFGLAGLIGAVPSDQVGGMVLATALGSAGLAAV